MEHNNWNGFKGEVWKNEINVRDFIQKNYTEYSGDDSFLAGATERTSTLMKKVESLFALERQFGGVLDIDILRCIERGRVEFAKLCITAQNVPIGKSPTIIIGHSTCLTPA